MQIQIEDLKAPLEMTIHPTADDDTHLSGSEVAVMMGRAPDCPMFQLNTNPDLRSDWNQLKDLNSNKCTLVGMAVLIEDQIRQQVLITQRQSHMRSFKGEWVLPGGHFESSDKSWKHAAAREVQEEVGLVLDPETFQLFAAWESVFPTRLTTGLPTRHHLVLYYYARWSEQRPPALTLQEEEVKQALWFDRERVRQELESDRLVITQGTKFCLERWLDLTPNSQD